MQESTSTTNGDGSQRCPVCQLSIATIPGGETMAEHVDRCLRETAASEEHRLVEQQLEQQRRLALTDGAEEVYEMNGETRIRLTSLTGFAGNFLYFCFGRGPICLTFLIDPGTGFSIRNPAEQDVDDDLDIEGADEDEFGEAQFDEADIIGSDSHSQAGTNGMDADMDGGERELLPTPLPNASIFGASLPPARARTLRDLVAEGKVSRNGIHDILIAGVKGKGVDHHIHDSQVSTRQDTQQVVSAEDVDAAVEAAIISGDKDALITALQKKLQHIVG